MRPATDDLTDPHLDQSENGGAAMTEQREDWIRWPDDWPAMKAGAGCVLCAFVATEDPAWGVRVYTGRVANAYLATIGQIRGYLLGDLARRSRL